MDRKRTALITGGTRGIGRSIAEAFADNGYNIAFCYKNSSGIAAEFLNSLIKREINAIKIKCDVSNAQDVKNMYLATRSQFGFVDTVINNAGISRISLFQDETEDSFCDIVNNNLKSVFLVTNAYVNDMIQNKFGRIINISSIFASLGAATESLYSMTKAGVEGLTKSLAKELALSGITVNAIAPGFINTDMTKIYSKDERKEIISQIPANRAGEPKEIAAAALFLASKESAFITGQTLKINGGQD